MLRWTSRCDTILLKNIFRNWRNEAIEWMELIVFCSRKAQKNTFWNVLRTSFLCSLFTEITLIIVMRNLWVAWSIVQSSQLTFKMFIVFFPFISSPNLKVQNWPHIVNDWLSLPLSFWCYFIIHVNDRYK